MAFPTPAERMCSESARVCVIPSRGEAVVGLHPRCLPPIAACVQLSRCLLGGCANLSSHLAWEVLLAQLLGQLRLVAWLCFHKQREPPPHRLHSSTQSKATQNASPFSHKQAIPRAIPASFDARPTALLSNEICRLVWAHHQPRRHGGDLTGELTSLNTISKTTITFLFYEP